MATTTSTMDAAQARDVLETTPTCRGLMGKQIAQGVLDGSIDAEEAGRVLLARAIRKITSTRDAQEVDDDA